MTVREGVLWFIESVCLYDNRSRGRERVSLWKSNDQKGVWTKEDESKKYVTNQSGQYRCGGFPHIALSLPIGCAVC